MPRLHFARHLVKSTLNPHLRDIHKLELRKRTRAACVHLLFSLVVASAAAALVFVFWYPGSYRAMAGGGGLYLLLISVDVVLGPLLTFAVFDLRKGWQHLRRDLAIICLIQLSALAYGLSVVMAARPIAMVFEVDRFRVLNRDQIRLEELPSALPAFRELPLSGPWVLGTRKARNTAESQDALFTAIDGIDIGQRPSFWQPYAESRVEALAKSRPVALLMAQYPTRIGEIREQLRAASLEPTASRFLPVMARGDWVAILDQAGNPVTFLPIDGFF